jgi:hypothetical protein
MGILNNYLIDLTRLKRNSLIHGNVNDDKLQVIVRRVQKQKIEPLLGTLLYKELLTAVTSFSADQKTLVDDYIQPVLAIYCEAMTAQYQNVEIRNKNTGRSNDEHQRANTDSENATFVSELYKDAKTYEKTLIAYLCDKAALFPNYDAPSTLNEDINHVPLEDSWDDTIGFLDNNTQGHTHRSRSGVDDK